MGRMNEISESDTTRDALVKFAGSIRYTVAGEWASRTWYGKLWFPVWFILSTIQWVIFGVFMTVILLAINSDNILESAARRARSWTPDTHVEDEDVEECETA